MSGTGQPAAPGIAIIGLAGRFPGARNVAELWRNLRAGVESIAVLSDEELREADVDPRWLADPGFVKAAAVLDDVELFDASFFNINPREAAITDPQHRIFLECAWEALESAGYARRQGAAAVGVFAGVGMNRYLLSSVLPDFELINSLGSLQLIVGNDKDYLATRVAYKLNLNGPAVNVQTACSTSLVAVSLACQSLLDYHCDMALAGGVNLRLPQRAGYRYEEGGIASPDGHCRAFDAAAGGTVFGSGAGVVVLKRLEDALADGDEIRAVIRGFAVNNDGAAKIGFTAPSVDGQREVISEALSMAAIHPESVSYVEAHGTGTPLGDPIEIAALTQAFRSAGARRSGYCALGSVKTNLGHLDTAAGAAGLIKTVLALEHRQIPPSLHFVTQNPQIDFAASPFFVNTTLREWPADQGRRRAGVSSFGIGGTNCHLLLEEAPPKPPSAPGRPWQLLVLSARTAPALEEATDNLADYLRQSSDRPLADAAYTLQVGRAPFEHRRCLVCSDATTAAAALAGRDPGPLQAQGEVAERSLGFLFPGQGTQYVGMGSDLYATEPTFREQLNLCARLLTPHLGLDLRQVLYPGPGAETAAAAQLAATRLTQPALFAVEYALAQLWSEWGLKPELMLGHSLGEYVAACLAEVFTLEDALALVAARGRLMQELPAGAMLAVALPEAEARSLLGPRLSLAAVNAPALCVCAGPPAAIDELAAELGQRGVDCRRLKTSHAFHSAMMEPVLGPFGRALRGIQLHAPRLPFVSGLSGRLITAAEATDPEYWTRQLRDTVRFSAGVEEVLRTPGRILLEVGPGHSLQALARQQPGASDALLLGSLRHPREEGPDHQQLLASLGRAWVAGAAVDWQGFHAHSRRRRVSLPTYPFARQRHWAVGRQTQPGAGPVRTAEATSWFRVPVWKRSALPAAAREPRGGSWLLLAGTGGQGEELRRRLAAGGDPVVMAVRGGRFARLDADTFEIDHAGREPFGELLATLRVEHRFPARVAWVWGRSPGAGAVSEVARLATALGQAADAAVELTLVTGGGEEVTGGEDLDATAAAALGLLPLAALPYPRLTCRAIDLPAVADGGGEEWLGERLAAELSAASGEPLVALRHRHRWVPLLEPVWPETAARGSQPLRDKGAYLLVGGLSDVGLAIAEHLARRVSARLLLIDLATMDLPPRAGWQEWLAAPRGGDALAGRVRRLLALEEAGSRVEVVATSLVDGAAARHLAAMAGALYGELDGVVVATAGLRLASPGGLEGNWEAKARLLSLLDEALAAAPLDFRLVCTSLAATTGNAAAAREAAADRALAIWARQRERSGDALWRIVSWELAGATAPGLDPGHALSREQLGEAWERALSLDGVVHALVSPLDPARRGRAVPAPRESAAAPTAAGSGDHAPPRNDIERAVVATWEYFLGRAPISIYDSFLELGGHSLLAPRVVGRLREELAVNLPLQSLFEAPHAAALAAEIATLRASQAAAGPVEPELKELVSDPDRRYAPFPLTEVQQAYWIGRGGAFELGNVAAHIYHEVEDDVDLERLTLALRRLIDRHDMLRAVVRPDGLQQILERVPAYTLRVHDLRQMGTEESREALAVTRRRLARELAPTDSWPLFAVEASLLDEHRTRVHVRIDYLISDAWSLRILGRELAALYADSAAELRPIELSFRDYVLAAIALRDSELYRRSLDYWSSRLPGLPPAPELPLARSPATLLEPRFERRRGELSPEAWTRLKARMELAELAPSAVLATVFSEVLAEWCKSRRFTLNLTLFNRLPVHPQVDDIIGDFTSLTLLEVDLTAREPFADRVRRVQRQLWSDLDHRYVSAVQVLRDLAQSRGEIARAAMPVVFTSTVSMGGGEESARPAPAQAGETVYGLNQGPQIWIDHQVFENAGRLRFNWDSVAGLFPDGLLDDMFSAYRALLDRLVEDEEAWREPVPPLLPEAQLDIRRAVNGTFAPLAEELLHTRFMMQARLRPQAPAVLCAGRTLSYGELLARADSLARQLRDLGARRNALVAVAMEKGWEQVVAVLAILRAGAAYLPIDATLPAERFRHLLTHGEVELALTQSWVDAVLPWPPEVRRLCVDRDEPAAAEAAAPALAQGPGDLAYVIYTSGSTGLPKGVMIDHRGALNTVLDVNHRFAVGSEDSVLALSSLSFDLSVYDIFGLLAAGGRIVLPEPEAARDAARWAVLLAEHRVTLWNTVPALLEMLVEHAAGRPGIVPESLRLALLSGDWIPLTLPERVRTLVPGIEVISLGGATEASIWSILYPIGEVAPAWKSIPYGRPMTNQCFAVLDERLAPRPTWVPGHLFIGGAGVALGYWRDEERTQASFVRHPFTGERLYRTGDLGRYLPDGTIEFLGREDSQVKVQGYRIELGEIEAAIGQHPEVHDVVVTAAGDPRGERRLVAYVVPKAPQPVAAGSEDSIPTVALAAEQVAQWQELFDETYGEAPATGPAFNFAGWTSSYSGEAIPVEEMRIWAESTAERILELRPSRVLEIGCGTGLLLFRIAPHCARYHATDLSAQALAAIERQLAAGGGKLPQVTLARAAATDLEGIAPGSFDAVILNSVAQYFPDVDYLLRVLTGAVAAVAPGGFVFVGDVRDRQTLPAFLTAIELAQASPTLSCEQLRQRLATRLGEEEELVVDPAFFQALGGHLPGLGGVELRPKRGRHRNELTQFRFDAVLHVGPRSPAGELCWRDWRGEGMSLPVLREELRAGFAAPLALRGVPNARVLPELAALGWLDAADGPRTAAELRQRLATTPGEPAVDPEDLWDLGEELGCAVSVALATGSRPGGLDVVFSRRGDAPAEGAAVLYPGEHQPGPVRPWWMYANNPLRQKLARALVPQLQTLVRDRLPEYMAPSAWVLLERLPLTANGKVDRGALPAPEMAQAELAGRYVAPRDAAEERLAEIWAQVLRRERIGIHDSFFDLGGHSLLATQVISRVREAFAVELPLRRLFEAPTVAGLAAAVTAAHQEAPAAGGGRLSRAARDKELPLSFSQQRLWFLDQLSPGNASYNMPAGVRLEGRVDLAAMQAALNEVVRRHEALRTRFPTTKGQPFQVIAPAAAVDLPWIDFRSIAEGEYRDAEVLRLTAAEAQRPFDLARGPLLRATLMLLGPQEIVLLLTVHHIVSDGWSMNLLYRELGVLYEAFLDRHPSPMPELPLQYVDFACWQRQYLTGENRENHLAYWRQQLTGLPALQLPTDRPRPRFETFRGGSRSTVLDQRLVEGMKAVGQSHDVTMFMTFLAIFEVLLLRYSGQSDIVVGSATAARNHPDLEGLIGLFLNMLVLRVDLAGNPGFGEAVQRVRRTTLEAYEHQDLPFEMLVDEIQPERDPSRNPLCQVLLMYQNYPAESRELSGYALKLMRVDSGTAKFDLILFLDDIPGGVQAKLEYNADLFDAATAGRMLGHFEILLQATVDKPGEVLSRLPLLTEGERHQLLTEWNDTALAQARTARLERLFERQAESWPDAMAVVCEGAAVTYRDLDERANRLAHHLISLEVRPGDFVAVFLDRSIEMIEAVLGILKAGAAYVPLEVSYPKARIAWICSHLGIRCVLTQESLVPVLHDLSLAHLVCLDESGEGSRDAAQPPNPVGLWRRADLAGKPRQSPRVAADVDDIAYVIFTSGSTGTPKGVVVVHAAAFNLIDWVNRRFAVGPWDRVLFVTSLCFDLSVYDIFGLLAAGGSIRVAVARDVRDPERLLQILRKEPITFWDSAPAALQQLVPLLPREPIQSPLRLTFLSGDWIPLGLPDQLKMAFPSAEVIGLGGATEATIWSNYYPVVRLDPHWVSIPYGRPIQNARYHVLDGELSPVPAGVPGELYIGAECLSLGYSEPVITAGSFLPDLFSSTPGGRLYQTGDLARYRADGNLEFLGRIDQQVKVRGFRIELGEIEAVLSRHPKVLEAVVIVREDEPGDQRLVAYVVAAEGGSQLVAELRLLVQQHLPQYMLPSAFVALASLPVTANGKLDRRALPRPEKARSERPLAAPRNPVEEVLVGIWSEVLGVEEIGIEDNFFELGGHSLLATQVVSRAAKVFGVELPLRLLFEVPTVAGLSAGMERTAGLWGAAPPVIEPVSRELPIPLSFSQLRLWLLDRLEPGQATYNIPAAVRMEGRLDVASLARSLGEIVRRHEALRTTFELRDDEPVQVIAEPRPLPLPVVDLAALPAMARWGVAQRLKEDDARRPFDLERGPLFRMMLVRLAMEDHLAIINMHHIVSDEWSVGVFVREVATLYQAFASGQPSPLPELPIQYPDFASWQRRWLNGERLGALVAYWQDQLAGAPAVLDLPFDRPRPAVRTFRGAIRSRRMPTELSKRLQALGRAESATLFMVLLAGFETLLCRYTEQTDLCIGTPIAGRTQVEIEDLLGFFGNTLVLRGDLGSSPGFIDLLARTREAALGAFAHQILPFEKLVDELQPVRSLSHSPLFQVVFVFQNAPRRTLDLPGLRLSRVESDSTSAKFDLTLIAEEAGDRLAILCEHNTDLFDGVTIERLLDHLERLLAGAVAAPHEPVDRLSFLSPAEAQQLVSEWSGGAAAGPVGSSSLHELFEGRAEQTPDAVAVVCETERITYRDLEERAGRLARHLRTCGVTPQVRVGIFVERSLDLVVAILGVLKAGGAYVPIDSTYPAARVEFVLADAGASLVLTQSHLASHLPQGEYGVVLMDSEWPAIARCDGARFPSGANAGSVAYVIYTSGSTGRPKGVMVTHGQVVRLFSSTREWFGFDAQDTWTLFHSYAFDFSVWELWGALLHGGRLVVVPYWVSRSPEALHKLLSGEGVTVLNQTPSAFQELVRSEEDLGRVDSEGKLRLVIFGGEALNPAMLRPWFDRHGADRPRLVNMYGITETTVHVTYRPVSPTDVGSGGSPIGVPIADLKVHLVDRWQQLVPLGVAGEMLVGGAGVAVGYLGRPVLTAERFVPDPFAAAPGLRLYRSGDLARRRPDGELEYLGRIDQQVKIRGFRIELGEIEQALRLHPGVQDAVAMAREVAGGGRRLVAYFVPSPEAPLLTPEELRSLLLDKLPEYMVPAAFVKLQSLPLSPNGKLDRHALPAPGLVRPEEDLAEPRTTAERILVQIWSEVLGTPQVGIHDNFFALGGDSILSLLIVSRAGRAGLQLAPRQLFQHQTIAELATVTGAAGEAQAEQGEVAGEAPLTPIQHFFLDSLPSDPHHFNQALLLEVRQAVDPVRLRAAIEVLQRQHDALRLRFERRENGWRQFHATSQAPAPFTLFALEGLPPAMRTAAVSAVAAEMQTSLDLLSGPLLRVALFELGEGKTGRFFLVAHHLVVDGVSWRILLEDLESAYSQLQSGEAVRLPPKTTSFRQWAWRLEEHARSRAVEEEMPYWLDRRRAAVTRLPVDRQRGFNPASLARIVQVSLDPERTRDLLRRVPETFRTQVNDVLLTALARALSDWTGARRLLVDLEGHGREEIAGDLDVSRTVGWFTTLFPVLLEIDPAETPVETLKSVKEQLRLITGAGLGYGLLRYLKGPEVAEPLRALPQAEVSFNYLGQVDHVLPEASPFARAQEATGPARSPSQPRSHLLDVDGIVVGERLQVNWTYGEGIHDRATVERLAGRFMEELRTLIEHCLCLEAGGFTPSDFPLARLDQETLDRLTSGLSAIEDIYPLLPLQHGLLFHSLQAPGSGVYVQQLSCTLVGDLEVDAFKNAWQALIDRHTVLRTGFASQHLEEPLQIVYHQARIPVEEQDWSDLPGDDFLSWLAAFLQADRERGFDLSRAPLMRLSLIRLGPGLCHLVWTYHHLVLDGWSIPILLREVFGFYGAILRKRQLDLVPAPPYRAYIEWFQRQDGAQTESFWRGLLKGFVPTPLARSATGEAGEIVERSLLLTAEESQAIVEMVRRCQLTLNTLAQGAWSLVLSHLGESDDVAFGTTISVRPPALAGVEAMLGVLLNTLPVRVRISSQERLIDWLRRLQTQQSEMRQYEHAPLAEVQRWSEVPRGSQLFESTLTVQNYPVDQALREQDTGLEIRDVRFIEKATYPVSMALMPAARIPLQIRYDSRRFDAASGERFLQLFKILLCAFAAREEAPIPWFRDVLEDYDRQQRTAQEEEYQEARRQKLKVVRRRSLQMTGGADAKGEGKP